MKHTCLIIAIKVGLSLIVATPAYSAQGDIGPVYIERVVAIALPSGGHQAGNLELKILGGFAIPAGVNCDGSYITTLRSNDIDMRLFLLSSLAQTKKQPVYLRISDDQAYTAFSGRCSLIWVMLSQ